MMKDKDITKILLLDDEFNRYQALDRKKQMFANRLHVGELKIDWVDTVDKFCHPNADLWNYQMIMFDHDMPDREGAGLICVRHLIKTFQEINQDLMHVPLDLRPICWVHSTNVPRAQQMEEELAEHFNTYRQSFPELISHL
jgi:hypothetical protein